MELKELDRATIRVVQESYGRCLANGKMIETFYQHFLSSSDEVAEKFKNTDFEQQYKLLRHGLNLMIMFAEGNVAGQAGISRIRESHSKHRLNIAPHFYPVWKSSLLKAISQHDRKFDSQVREAWSDLLEVGIRHIIDGYNY